MTMLWKQGAAASPSPKPWLAVALAAAIAGGISLTAAQSPTTAPHALDGQTFLRLAHSSAVMQARAAELAATKETRPEVKTFAKRMVEFRRRQILKLIAAAHQHTLAVSPTPEFEHRVVVENLEPLDFLALSRRYAEVQVEALEREVRGYATSEGSPDEWVRTFARDSKPELQRLLDEARQVRHAVGS